MNSLTIFQGDADTLTSTVTGISSLSGYIAKMFFHKKDGTWIDTITGTIATLTITYEIVNNDSVSYPIGTHEYEEKIVDASDHIYTLNKGRLIIKAAQVNNPHIT